MSFEYRKITGEDYIPDMIETLNQNFEAAKEAIDDINEVVNEGDIQVSSITNNPNGELADVSYEGVGRMVNQGDVESTETVRGKNLSITQASTFGGNLTANGNSTFQDTVFQGTQVEMNTLLRVMKAMSMPTRTISNVVDTNTVGAVSDTYTVSIDGDNFVILNQGGGSDLIQGARWRLTNGAPNQVIKFTALSIPVPIFIELNGSQDFEISSSRESVTLLWNQLNEATNEGEWVIIDHSLNFDASRIITS